ncbi:MAG: hypothetical protein RL038_205 [Actinomycetota bacterium]|jgi:chloramphenicol-sensitive protein RarD
MELDSRYRRGLLYGISAYLIWGLFPLYWPLLKPASALEILAHRMTWSLVFLAFVNQIRKSWPAIKSLMLNRRSLRLLAFASVMISINWGLYIWAVNNEHVVDASLGYFMNPLINVALGVLYFRERLNKFQWSAIAVAGIGVAWLALQAGAIPWVGLALAFSFGLYGLTKKVVGADGVESLTVETILLLPLSASYLLFIEIDGSAAFLNAGVAHAVLAVMAGVVTAVPLLAFGAAAIRIPYSTMGFIQYITPTMQFLLGITVMGESMSSARWIGFIFIWSALVIFTLDALRNRKAS